MLPMPIYQVSRHCTGKSAMINEFERNEKPLGSVETRRIVRSRNEQLKNDYRSLDLVVVEDCLRKHGEPRQISDIRCLDKDSGLSSYISHKWFEILNQSAIVRVLVEWFLCWLTNWY